jgi:hypothetical protein
MKEIIVVYPEALRRTIEHWIRRRIHLKKGWNIWYLPEIRLLVTWDEDHHRFNPSDRVSDVKEVYIQTKIRMRTATIDAAIGLCEIFEVWEVKLTENVIAFLELVQIKNLDSKLDELVHDDSLNENVSVKGLGQELS